MRSAVALGTRQVLVQGLNVAGGVLLARLLAPAEFGVYTIITFVLAFLIAFGGAGLGASLIRQVEEPALADYRAVFTVQQIVVITLGVGLWFAAPWLAGAYGRPVGDAWLFRILVLALFLTSLQTIPAIRLERHLDFDRLAAIEVAQALLFNGFAVGLAWAGLGAMSFALALFVRAATGALLMNVVSPWSFGWHWDWDRVREHMRFGIPYQGVNLVCLLKDSITPFLIGLLLGAQTVGYVNWAGMVAAYPVLALMVFQRIYLPAFARMQGRPVELRRFVEGVLRATNTLVAPLAVLTLILIEPITRMIFGAKWMVALPLFYFLWAANLFVPTSTPLAGLLNATGDARTPFRFALLWMFGTWAIGAPLVLRFGAIGFAVANLVVQFSNVLLCRLVQARFPVRIWSSVLPPWIAAAATGIVLYPLTRLVPPATFGELVAFGFGGGLLYLVALIGMDFRRAVFVWSRIRSEGWHLGFR